MDKFIRIGELLRMTKQDLIILVLKEREKFIEYGSYLNNLKEESFDLKGREQMLKKEMRLFNKTLTDEIKILEQLEIESKKGLE